MISGLVLPSNVGYVLDYPIASVLICEAPETQYVRSDVALQRWLGDESTIDPLDQSRVGLLVTKKDPKCRFM